jgi:hypothetical protein
VGSTVATRRLALTGQRLDLLLHGIATFDLSREEGHPRPARRRGSRRVDVALARTPMRDLALAKPTSPFDLSK